jgi:formate dehydrogenase major subunit/formate dehydrogenase-N alpha subunit
VLLAASNETGILDGKFTRSLGMVAIDCQARLCHGPTVSALAPTFGRGAMTNNWVDIKNANVVLIMGGNAARHIRWALNGSSKHKRK